MSGILLDTHTWIWFMIGDETLKADVQRKIDQHLQSNSLWLACISVWELGMLENKGRITLTQPCLQWTKEALKDIRLAELTPEIAIESSNLPGDFHGDPADRIIVATARHKELTLATRDHAILNYSKKHYLSTLKS